MISAMFILHFWVMRAIYYFTASRCTIYNYMGGKYTQSEKKRRKSDKIFFSSFVLLSLDVKLVSILDDSSRMRAYAYAFQQRCRFFAVTSVTDGRI